VPQTLTQLLDGSVLAMPIAAGLIMGMLTVNVLMLVWAERKVSAWIQMRMGPTEVGPFGLLQTLADMLKLISKQLITPSNVDKPLYHLAPLLAFAPVIAAVALFPFSEHTILVQNDFGLLFVFAFGGIAVIAIFMAGWGSNNKYALLGAIRAVAQNISYEIPLILSALSVVLIVNSMGPTLDVGDTLVAVNGLDLSHIVMTQDQHGIWFVLLQPVAALVYFISALAETNRAPFDIPEAESELVAGFHTEYSGMRFSLFFFAEYTNMLIVSMLAVVLFFGGWDGPVLPGPLWFFLKSYTVILVMMWVRWTFPRLRFDQLMTFCWKVLIPLSILNLLATAFVIAVL
tara:strand:- start:142313 stop:143344 length:1032 start_codon:yes stop_codon:yes gene_type:complete